MRIPGASPRSPKQTDEPSDCDFILIQLTESTSWQNVTRCTFVYTDLLIHSAPSKMDTFGTVSSCLSWKGVRLKGSLVIAKWLKNSKGGTNTRCPSYRGVRLIGSFSKMYEKQQGQNQHQVSVLKRLRCPSYRQFSYSKMNEKRQGPTPGIRLTEVSVAVVLKIRPSASSTITS